MRRFLVFLSFVSAGAALWAQTGEEIMTRVRERENNRTVQARIQMILTNRSGQQTERLLDQYASRQGGTTRLVIVFHRPQSVANTRFLAISRHGEEDQRWIYLPNLGTVRRIALAEGSSSFVGTDFSYDDLTLREVERDRHEFKGEETLDGQRVLVVESTPRREGDGAYARAVFYILPDKWLPLRIDLFDRQGRPFKRLTASQIEQIQGVWTYRRARMENLQALTSTELILQQIRYDAPIPETVFTTRFLETGRP